MAEFVKALSITLILIVALSQVSSEALHHKYEKGDPVPLYVNVVGPFHNPSETYPYYNLPFCSPEHLKEKKASFGEMLNGDRLVLSPYKLDFMVDRTLTVLCRRKLSKEEVSKFRTAIVQDYYSQMYYDDMPLWAFIGLVDKDGYSDPDEYKYFLFTSLQFEIFYNGSWVIEINVRTEPSGKVELTEDKVVDVEFVYSVKWKKINSPFEKRMEKYEMAALLPHHKSTHQSAIVNSFWIILVLISCIVGLHACVLQRDFYKGDIDTELADNQDETGWKILHGDVFRYPNYKSFFAAAIGSGAQLLTATMVILVLGSFGAFRPYSRGFLKATLVTTYAIASFVAGFISVSFYHQLEGSEWMRNLSLSGSLFTGPVFLIFCILNTVAIFYGTTAAVPLGTVWFILLLWIFLATLLLSLGGILGKMIELRFEAPCHTTKCPRAIPALPWYRSVLPQMALAGLLPYGVIYIELYYILVSVWGHRIYMVYGILCVVFTLLLMVTALVSIGLTYFQLAAEDHRWWWRSFLCGGSTSLYVFAHCFHYYLLRSDMKGLIQTSFFFGYMGCVCVGLFLMLGTVGFVASLLFVRHIYGNIKCE